MNSPLLAADSLSKSFGDMRVLTDFSFAVGRGELVGLIGPNGAGKTTLFNILTGFLAAEGGCFTFRGDNITNRAPFEIARRGIGRTFQDVRIFGDMTVLENLQLALPKQSGELLRNVFLRRRKCLSEEEANRATAACILSDVGLTSHIGTRAKDLSYGQQKLLSLACCLAFGPDLLLLDEPVAGIAPEMAQKILALIRNLPGQSKSVVMIEHSVGAIWDVCDRVVFMDAGVKVSEGTPEQVHNDPRVIEAYLE